MCLGLRAAAGLVLVCLGAALGPGWAAGTLVPGLVAPEGVGVNIHFSRGHTGDLDMIAAAGIRWVRMDLGWAGIERQRGQYDWSAYDELTANLEARGLKALYILDYSNPLYEEKVTARNPVTGETHTDTASPQHPESVAAFARWAGAAAARYRGRAVIWEIWNEPNITFWKPKPDVRQYIELALAACRAIREADPQACIVAPATSEVPLGFLGEFFASGALDHLDAVSVHPYRSYAKPPETAVEDYRQIRVLIEKHAAPAKRQMPILSGEWGYASHAKGVTPEVQAWYVVRQQLVNLMAGVPISIWYDWKNDGPDPNEREHNFGLVDKDLNPKPAYGALQTLTRELAGARYENRLAVGSDTDYVLRFSGSGRTSQLAVWTTGASHELALPVKVSHAASARLVTAQGDIARLRLAAGSEVGAGEGSAAAVGAVRLRLTRDRLTLDVGPAPVYVRLEGIVPAP